MTDTSSEILCLRAELENAREHLRVATEALTAIQRGDIDALFVGEPGKQHIYTLEGADYHYRIFFEQMLQGAAVLDEHHTILYCNPAFEVMVDAPASEILATNFGKLLAPECTALFEQWLAEAGKTGINRTVRLANHIARNTLIHLAVKNLGEQPATWFVILTDIDMIDRLRQGNVGLELGVDWVWDESVTTSVTAAAFGQEPLKHIANDRFNELMDRYGHLLDLALEQHTYRVDHNLSNGISALAEELVRLWVSPRDVIELHTDTLRARCKDIPVLKAKALTAAGRLTIVQLMGHILSHYRRLAQAADRSMRPSNEVRPEPPLRDHQP